MDSAGLTALRRDGFVLLPDLLSNDALAAATRHADRLLDGVGWSGNDFDGRRTRRVYSPVVMPAGSAVVYSGRLWHGAGNSRSDSPRRALICEHVLPWPRPADNHILALGVAGLRRVPPMRAVSRGWPGRPTIWASSPGRIPRSGSPPGRIDECNHCDTATPTTPEATGASS